MSAQDTEPRAPKERQPFEEWDFVALDGAHARSPEYNDRRLAARRRLLGLGKELVVMAKSAGLSLDTRTSLHHPHAFNGNRVERIWTYVCRGKSEKTRLRKTLGRDLAKDLDSAYRNAYLCIAIDADGLEVSLRIHSDAWYDGQNLIRRIGAEGIAGWREKLNELDSFRLRIDDWKGEWRCGELSVERLEEFLKYYTPGEHRLTVERRWPVPRESEARRAALGDEVPGILVDEAARLLPLYRYTAWSEESDFLFTQ